MRSESAALSRGMPHSFAILLIESRYTAARTNARPWSPLERVQIENTASLPHQLRSISRPWFQLCAMKNSVLRLATLTAYRPPWTRKVSRPKSTDISPAAAVSQAAGIHGWPGSGCSKPGFSSRLGEGLGAAAAGACPRTSSSRLESATRRAKRDSDMGILSEWGRESDENGRNYELSGVAPRRVKEFCRFGPPE